MEQTIYDILSNIHQDLAVGPAYERQHQAQLYPVELVDYSLFDPILKYLEPVTSGKTRHQQNCDQFLSRWLSLSASSSHSQISRVDALWRLHWCCGGAGLDYSSAPKCIDLPSDKEMRPYMEKNLRRLRHPRHLEHPSEMEF